MTFKFSPEEIRESSFGNHTTSKAFKNKARLMEQEILITDNNKNLTNALQTIKDLELELSETNIQLSESESLIIKLKYELDLAENKVKAQSAKPKSKGKK